MSSWKREEWMRKESSFSNRNLSDLRHKIWWNFPHFTAAQKLNGIDFFFQAQKRMNVPFIKNIKQWIETQTAIFSTFVFFFTVVFRFFQQFFYFFFF